MLQLLIELLHDIGNLLGIAWDGTMRLGRNTANFTARAARAHHNLLGQYTTRIEQEAFGVETPPTPRDLNNIIGQIALTVLPVIPLAWLMSVTLTPLIYNAILMLAGIYPRLCNLALPADNENDPTAYKWQLKVPEGDMPWYRQVYGVGGLVLALLIGLPSMAAIAFGRMVMNSLSSLKLGYATLVNPLFDSNDQVIVDESVLRDTKLNKYVFGLPGFVFGAFAGLFVASSIVSWRALGHSALTAWNIAFSAGYMVYEGKLATKETKGGILADGRESHLKFGYGVPGMLFGALLAAPAMLAALLARVAYDSFLSIGLSWFGMTNPLHVDAGYLKADEATIPEDVTNRSWFNKYITGAPGLFIGALGAVFTSTFVVAWELARHSWESGTRMIYSAGFLVSNDRRASDGGIEDDATVQNRPLRHIFGYGLPGLVLGAPIAALSMGIVATARMFMHSLFTTWNIAWSAGYMVFKGELATKDTDGGILADRRDDYLKLGFGAPGMLFGALLAAPAMLTALLARVAYESVYSMALAWLSMTDPLHIDAGYLKADEAVIPEHYTNRPWFNKYLIGAPGLLIGALGAVFTSTFVIGWQLVKHSWQSGTHMIRSAGFLAWNDERATEGGIEDDVINKKRPPHHIFGYGLPGLILGAPIAALSMLVISPVRAFKHSVLTAWNIAFSAAYMVYEGELATKDTNVGILADGREGVLKFGYGAPGMLFGALLAAPAMFAALLVRVAYDSSLSTALAWLGMTNPLHVDAGLLKAEEAVIPESLTNRSWLNKYITGAPGFLIGALGAAFTSTFVVGWQLLKHSFESATKMIWSAGFLAWHDRRDTEDGIEGDVIKKKRPLHHIFGYGLPGLVLGAPLAALGMGITAFARTFENSARTAWQIVYSAAYVVFNGERAPNGGIETDGRENYLKFGFGAPGAVFGALLAAPVMFATLIARVAYDSMLSIAIPYVGITEPLHIDAGLRTERTTLSESITGRSFANRYILGAPGILIGSLAGLVNATAVIAGLVVRNTWQSAVRMIWSAGFLAWHDRRDTDDGIEGDVIGKKRPLHHIIGYGLPGLVLGAPLAALAMLVVSPLRVFKNSVLTAWNIVFSAGYMVFNVELATKETKGGILADGREGHLKFGYGAPGILFGALLAAPAMFAAMLARVAYDSGLSTALAWLSMTDPLHVDAGMLKADEAVISGPITERPWFRKYLIGAPGLLIGALGAVFTSTFVIGWQLLKHSWQSGSHMIHSAGFLAWNDERAAEGGIEDDVVNEKRKLHHIFGYGLPGLVLGAPIAALGMGILATMRSFKHSALTAWNIAFSAGYMTFEGRLATKDTDGGILADGRESHLKFGYGAPGMLFGALLAAPAMLTAMLARVAYDSGLSTALAWLSMTGPLHVDAGLLKAEEAVISGPITDRPWFRKYLIGAPGLLIGALGAVFTSTFVVAWQLVKHSWQSGTHMIHSAGFLAWNDERATEGGIEDDVINEKRKLHHIFAYGLPGLILGAPIAALGMGILATVRTFMHSAITAWKLTWSAGYAAWHDTPATEGGIETATPWYTYGYGLPGLLPGAFMAATAALLVLTFRMLRESAFSFVALSGSFLNGGLNIPRFEGLAGDNRNAQLKIAGAPGYLMAVALTLPVSTLIFAGKFVAPQTLFLILGVALSPFVSLLKWANLGLGRARFEAAPEMTQETALEVTQEAATEQRFKNLYSSLDGWGQLPEDGVIAENADGRKGPLCFTRKAVTLNVASLPERLLEDLLQAWRDPATDREQFFLEGGAFSQAIAETQARYGRLSCMEFQNTIDDRIRHIDELGDFVKNYLQGQPPSNPPRLQQPMNWSANFYGRRASHEAPAPGATTESTPLLAS